jgi:hypothetical protein
MFALLTLREAAAALIFDTLCAHAPVASCLSLVLEQRQVLVAVIESRAVVVLIISSPSVMSPFSFDEYTFAVLKLVDAADSGDTEVFSAAIAVVTVQLVWPALTFEERIALTPLALDIVGAKILATCLLCAVAPTRVAEVVHARVLSLAQVRVDDGTVSCGWDTFSLHTWIVVGTVNRDIDACSSIWIT